jgi:CubicO group peptidase (beta-lactamase class C family)
MEKSVLDMEIIDKLDIPSGLKELLVSRGLTVRQLLSMKSGDIAEALGIDQDAARLIVAAPRLEAEPRQHFRA